MVETNKLTQLTLHAGLGALTNGLTGNDMLSGAVSGVMGEVVGEYFGNNTNLSDDALKEIGGLAGGVSSLIAGKLQGLEYNEIVSNIFTGQRLGKNAVENNYLLKTGQVEQGDTIKSITKEINEFYGTNLTEDDVIKINAVADANNLTVGEVIAVGTIGENGEIWNVPFNSSIINMEYWEDLSDLQKQIVHYHRNNFSIDTSGLSYNTLLNDTENWSNKGETLAHNVGTSGNIDFRGKNNFQHQQIIANQNTGKIVNTPENMGTYDYELPGFTNSGFKKHNVVDVDPWIVWGNTTKDTTTIQQRLDSLTGGNGLIKPGKMGFDRYIKNNENSLYYKYIKNNK